MPDGDIYESSVDGLIASQAVTNVHHSVQIGTDGTGDPRVAVASIWATFFQTAFLNCVVDDYLLTITRTRRLFPTQTQSFVTNVALNGNVVGDPLPTNQCAILRQYGTLTVRKGVGHVKMPGVDDVFVDEGRVNASYVGLAEIFGNVFEVDQTHAASGFVFRSCVLGTDNVARQIQATKMTGRIKQIRSRTIGVGD